MLRKSLAANGAKGASVLAARFALALLALLALPVAAVAGEFGIKVEPGVAFPLTRPQSQRFDFGGGAATKLMYGLGRYLDVTAGVSFLGLPRSATSLSSGTTTAWGYGGGLRLKKPHDSQSESGVSPWIDADALYIRTGPLNRFGFAAATGLAFPLGEARRFWLGPFVRYQHIVGRGGNTVDGRDAKVLLAGLSFEFGSSPMHPREVAPEAAPVPAPAVVPEAPPPPPPPAPVPEPVPVPVPESDRDHDGTPDKDDLCPDVAGPVSNQGCPVYEKIIIKPNKLELKEKIQFARNSPRIVRKSHPILDEVVKALQENKNFRVQIQGHASSEGAEKHNLTLSTQRAQAVLDYLVSHGVAKERLASQGFGSSVPIDSNTTAAGRENNRRVEFVVNSIDVNPESGK